MSYQKIPGIKMAGVVGGMGLRVKMLESPNEHVKKGTEGILVPIELSVDGDVINAKFYPFNPDGTTVSGFGLVTWPAFRSIT